ncbi:nucleotide exchange factor GrpE [Sorangium sp. So ce131]|uniref:nucleotide exchange factor GrpE n=1 Tax=Sorangium sp. So ce131 TaxID=3133282 RepID=UPI003F5F35DD
MMEETPSGAPPEDIGARLAELVREVRRQGRAAVAAQAAAESCLEQVTALARAAEQGRAAEGARGAGGTRGSTSTDAAPRPAEELSWLGVILPVADALDRAVAQASAMVERRARAERAGFWPFRRRAEPDPELGALAEGLRVLRAQLVAALEGCGVTVDRRVGVAVDPEVHRVVEVRPPEGAEPEGVVVDVIRPGYAARGRLVREADVVATGAPPAAGPGWRAPHLLESTADFEDTGRRGDGGT